MGDDTDGGRDGYVFHGSRREHQRLNLQAQVWEEATRRALSRLGLPNGANALDVGCGPGDAMQLIGEQVGTRGSVTGLDFDPNLGETQLARLCEDNPRRYRFVSGDVTQIQAVPGGPFDLVFARLLLFHISKPEDVLRRLWSWTRPGGVLLIMDYDTTTTRTMPQHPTLEWVLRLINDAFRRAGRDIETGLRMPELFCKAGIPEPDQCEIGSVILRAQDTAPMLQSLLKSLRPIILKSRLAEETELKRLDAELEGSEFENTFARWPDLVTTWKRKSI
jgi:ubiquinone/menaquinone biosynthesis C-methylase UbiE